MEDPTLFQCPFCQSMVLKKNVLKHLKSMHQDTKTIHKYVECTLCEAYILKNKYTPHLRKIHGVLSQKSLRSQLKSK